MLQLTLRQKVTFLHETNHGSTHAAFKHSLFPDNDLSYSIPHMVKCWTEAVNNLSQSLETCTMLKIILLKLKFIKKYQNQ